MLLVRRDKESVSHLVNPGPARGSGVVREALDVFAGLSERNLASCFGVLEGQPVAVECETMCTVNDGKVSELAIFSELEAVFDELSNHGFEASVTVNCGDHQVVVVVSSLSSHREGYKNLVERCVVAVFLESM